MGFTPTAPAASAGPVPKASRWAKSDTTFGPFVLGGAGIWAALMVMGLRQVWQLVAYHHRR
jgi:hypothetical protein